MKPALLSLGLLLGSFAAAAAEPDAQKGHALARNVCSACHVVEADQEAPPTLEPAAPDFPSIVGRPGTSAASLRRFLQTTHTTIRTPKAMPKLHLVDEEIADVAAFMMTLRRQPPS